MIVPSLLSLGFGLGALWLYGKTSDDVLHLSLIVHSLFFMTVSFWVAPWPIQLAVLISILCLTIRPQS